MSTEIAAMLRVMADTVESKSGKVVLNGGVTDAYNKGEEERLCILTLDCNEHHVVLEKWNDGPCEVFYINRYNGNAREWQLVRPQDGDPLRR